MWTTEDHDEYLREIHVILDNLPDKAERLAPPPWPGYKNRVPDDMDGPAELRDLVDTLEAKVEKYKRAKDDLRNQNRELRKRLRELV